MSTQLCIGLICSYSLAYCRDLQRGIKEYAARKNNWVLAPVAPEDGAIESLRDLRPAGIIAHVYSAKLLHQLKSRRLPLVNVCGVLPDTTGVPRVGLDDNAIGDLAASHLLDRGLRNFAFVGQTAHRYSQRREAAFRRRINQAGLDVACYHESGRDFHPRGRLWGLNPLFKRWVRGIARPVGIFACNDIWGVQIAEACRQARLRVPEEVAIIGVDNDDFLCELARPSLSSVAIPSHEIGRRAAALLDRLLCGRRPPTRPVLLPPTGVTVRQSSDIIALSDSDVSAAVCFIRAHAHRRIGVNEVMDAVSVCRRTLERKFRRTLSRGILDEIRRVHVDRARRLLSDTDLPMSTVAANCGFADAKHLSVVFRQGVRATPTEYRRKFRGGFLTPSPA